MPDWNPNKYLQFASERTRPSLDLVDRIELDSPRSIIDIGCGPGNSTRVLADRWPGADITGLDSSRAMIERAKADCPNGNWIVGDASTDVSSSWDLVFSNAALQWMPGHETLVPSLFGKVNRGGAFAVQIPADSESPIRLALLEVASRPEWQKATEGCAALLTYRDWGFYYDLLAGAKKIDLWETTYLHVLDSREALIDWYGSTGMKPFLERLPDDESRARFEAEVLEACGPSYPVRGDGKVIYPFRRIFFIAYR
jgi:trans-aconitate 2-methyltransferase